MSDSDDVGLLCRTGATLPDPPRPPPARARQPQNRPPRRRREPRRPTPSRGARGGGGAARPACRGQVRAGTVLFGWRLPDDRLVAMPPPRAGSAGGGRARADVLARVRASAVRDC